MKILAIGDITGSAGCDFFCKKISSLKQQLCPDMVIVNGENATGRGISPGLADDFLYAGADIITLGNHAFDNRQILDYLDERSHIIRPYNLSPTLPGRGYTIFDCMGIRVCVANLIGRLDMDFKNADPFSAADYIIKNVEADAFVFDFHANATSEKKAMGYHLDGRAAAVFGTHTHVQTSDAHVLPLGTGFICDLGMTGGQESVIGVKYEQSVAYFNGKLTSQFENSGLDCRIQGALFTVDNGKCTKVTAVDFK